MYYNKKNSKKILLAFALFILFINVSYARGTVYTFLSGETTLDDIQVKAISREIIIANEKDLFKNYRFIIYGYQDFMEPDGLAIQRLIYFGDLLVSLGISKDKLELRPIYNPQKQEEECKSSNDLLKCLSPYRSVEFYAVPIIDNAQQKKDSFNSKSSNVKNTTSSDTKKNNNNEDLVSQLIDSVIASNKNSIENLLNHANSSPEEINLLAIKAGRDHVFPDLQDSRNRNLARELNKEALSVYKSDINSAIDIQKKAIKADPLDLEIAGNLSLYYYKAGKVDESLRMTLYALSLPRTAEKTGRTADFQTLAASYASLGDLNKASAAMIITTAISTDIPNRCKYAISAANRDYGSVLRKPVEAMFIYIQSKKLTNSPECFLPIQWN